MFRIGLGGGQLARSAPPMARTHLGCAARPRPAGDAAQLETHLQELYTGESPPPTAALEALLMMMCADLTSRQSELAVKVQSALGELRHAMQTSHRALGYSSSLRR